MLLNLAWMHNKSTVVTHSLSPPNTPVNLQERDIEKLIKLIAARSSRRGMGKYRKRFNEKARSGMLAKQAALKKARNKQFFRAEETSNDVEDEKPEAVANDPNAEILKPMTDEEKLERKRKLQEQLFLVNEKEAKMSRAKKKRLDKYIDHQVKREEKKVLLEKLSHTKVDTSQYAPSKLLGTGKQTRREEMVEALELERQGRASDRTREILYEEREVKEDDFLEFGQNNEENREDSEDEEDETDKFGDFGTTTSTFIDSRPAKFGGSGSGFGFANLPVIEKLQPKKKYSWRKKLEMEQMKRAKKEEEDDFVSTSESDDSQSQAEDSEESSEEDEEAEEEPEDEVENDSDPENENNSSSEKEEENSESESASEVSEDSEDMPRLIQNKPKHSKVAESFKEWAEEQVKKLEGRESVPLLPRVSEKVKQEYSKPQVREEDIDHSSDEEGYIPINKNLQRDAFFVTVDRPDSIQQLRMQLPVFNEEHRIMEAINHHDCIVICGETGSGKTTQVPQFLYEAGYGNSQSQHKGMIGITQPRRVAAVSMANRLGQELGNHGHRVGYQIRFDSTISNEGEPNGTAVKFMTDGVLLREITADFMLTKYSAIIVDEAHERNINTDILIGLLSRLLKLRRQYHQKDPKKYSPLKLIIMSATLRVSDFSENTVLFKSPPPIIKVDARQYPVSVHFNKKTPFEYLDDAFNKACKIHRKLPPGGILIFLTSQAEITQTVKRLREEFPLKNASYKSIPKIRLSKDADAEAEEIDFSVGLNEKGVEEIEDDYNSDSEEEGFDEEREAHQTDNDPLYVLPLYSLLPTSEQMKVFQDPPAGARMCIVATNVAETSLTIPGIRYVIDSGRSKERKFNDETGVQSFEVDWISKASADQRAGRAGRTGPGHCYRLYSSAVYEDFFLQFSKPEILRMPVESVVLNMKSMGIDKIVNFPFPTPPDRVALKAAERLLVILGALDRETKAVTPTGKSMSIFPLSPRFAKILLIGDQAGCLPYIVALVSALSVGDPFIGQHEVHNDEKPNESTLSKFRKSRAQFTQLDPASDALMLLSAVCAMDHIKPEKRKAFFETSYLRQKVMEEIEKLRYQVYHIVKSKTRKDSIAEQVVTKGEKLPVPSKTQIAAIKQMIASGFLDQISIRGDLADSDVKLTNKMNVINVPYSTVFPTAKYGDELEKGVFIHPNSVLTSTGKFPPPYLVYQSLNLSQNKIEGKLQKLRMKPLVDITPKQLANLAKNTPLITYSKPLGHPYAPKNITSTKRECYVVPRFGAAMGESGIGWDLPVIKVIQVKKNGAWVIEH